MLSETPNNSVEKQLPYGEMNKHVSISVTTSRQLHDFRSASQGLDYELQLQLPI